MNAHNFEPRQLGIRDFQGASARREARVGRGVKALQWMGRVLCGMVCCSCCFNCCGGMKASFMTKEDEEDYASMSLSGKCKSNYIHGCINTYAACCCCGCCCGACGACGPNEAAAAICK
jgi:hypothetical protein